MTVAELIDQQVVEHLSLYGCVRNMDAYAQHVLKTSDHPLMVFRRTWMREMALKQHLESEARQKKITDEFKTDPVRRGASVRRRAVIDSHLAAEIEHYNKAPIKEQLTDIKAEAPGLFPKRTVEC